MEACSRFFVLLAELIEEASELVFSPNSLCFLMDRLRMLEHALMVEQALASVTLAAMGHSRANNSFEPPESLVMKNKELLIKLHERLSRMGPLKRLTLPDDAEVARDVKQGASVDLLAKFTNAKV